MAESHVLFVLHVRRADLTSDIRGMNEALAHLDATIKLLEGGIAPKFKPREVFDAIRNAVKG